MGSTNRPGGGVTPDTDSKQFFTDDAQRGGDGREDAVNQLDAELKSIFLHSRFAFVLVYTP